MCDKSTHLPTGYLTALIAGLILLSDTSSPAIANEDSANSYHHLCPADDGASSRYVAPREFPQDKIDHTEISADYTQTIRDGTTSLDGNVIIEQHQIRVTADHADYNKNDELLNFSGNVHIDTMSLSLDADGGTISLGASESNKDNNQGSFDNIRFYLPETNMKGKAGNIFSSEQVIEGRETQISVLSDASITTCELNAPDWLISADEIELDHGDEYGSAEDVVIRFKNVPFLYTPYIEFPISDKRRSGLLFPELGTSSSRGFELAAPWYWNIAPNQDAVITPRYMEKRGLELGGNYRYLTKSTTGRLDGNFLYEDSITEEKRYQVQYKQSSRIMSNMLFDINYHEISDADYFNDFTSSLASTSRTHLDRRATYRYELKDWRFRAMVQDIKTIDDTTPLADRPYVRLPQLTFNGQSNIAGGPLLFTFDSELVDFTHEDDNKTTGTRITLKPGLRLPMSGAAWFIDPMLKYNLTRYDVGTEAGSTQEVNDLSLPITSVDAGLFFERYLDSGYQQTLEPRLYYLNVPYEDQSGTPLFDTSSPTFSVAQLFRDNRFIGGDRIGDANQLTLALSSRILNTNTGDELLRASIGQIFYFEDRRVSLDGTVDTANQSDIIAELGTNIGRWQGNIQLQLDTTYSELSQENYFLHYQADSRTIFNLGYRKRLDDRQLDIEQTDTSFVYPFNMNYSGFFRWNYSLKDNKDIDTIAGIAYDSCCWSIQVLAQRRIKNTTTTVDDAYDNSILVQFVFKGLGSLSGSKAKTTLEQSIYGYRDIFQ
jgi:LPS-assembly protein